MDRGGDHVEAVERLFQDRPYDGWGLFGGRSGTARPLEHLLGGGHEQGPAAAGRIHDPQPGDGFGRSEVDFGPARAALVEGEARKHDRRRNRRVVGRKELARVQQPVEHATGHVVAADHSRFDDLARGADEHADGQTGSGRARRCPQRLAGDVEDRPPVDRKDLFPLPLKVCGGPGRVGAADRFLAVLGRQERHVQVARQQLLKDQRVEPYERLGAGRLRLAAPVPVQSSQHLGDLIDCRRSLLDDLLDASTVVALHPVVAQLLRQERHPAYRVRPPFVPVVPVGDRQVLGGRQVGVGVAFWQVGQPLGVSHGHREPKRQSAHHRGPVGGKALVGVGLGGRAELRLDHDGVVVEVEQDIRLSSGFAECLALLSLRVESLVTEEPGEGEIVGDLGGVAHRTAPGSASTSTPRVVEGSRRMDCLGPAREG